MSLVVLAACHASAPPPTPASPQTTPARAAAARAERPWLGVRFEPGTTRIVQVVEGSPAAAAGLRVGDEIVSLDGVEMHASQQIVTTVAESQTGHRMSVTFDRAGAQQTLVIALAARPRADHLMRDSLLDRPAPAFTASTLDGGTPLALADLRGEVVLVDFWATWCGPCTTQFAHLNDWHRRYASRGLHILALSDEEPDLVREYVASQRLAYPVALDPDDRIRAAYLVPGMPTTVIIDRTGVVRYVTVGAVDPAEIEGAFTRLLR